MEDAGPELALRKLTQTFGVTEYVILNKNGIPVQYHGMEEPKAIQFAGLFSELVEAAQLFLKKRYTDITSTDEDQELVALRLRSHECEYIVCPEKDYCLIVVHNPNWVEPPHVEVAVVEGEGGEDGEGGEGGGDTER